MYIVKIDGNFLFGTGKYERPGYEIISPVADLAVNTAGTFTFTIYSEHPRYDDVDNTKSIVTVEKDGEEEPVFRGRVLSAELGFYNEKKVICEGELAFLCDSIQNPYNFTADSARKTIKELLEFFIRRHNEKTGMDDTRKFQLGEVTVTDGDTSNTDNLISAADSTYSNTYDSIKKKLIERYGGYLYVRHTDTGNYIDYLSTPPETCSQKIEFGENLLDIRKNIDADSLVTAVIPLGKELTNTTTDQTYRQSIEGYDAENYIKDDDIVQVKDATGTFAKYYSCLYSKSGVEKYGWIEKTLIFDDVVTPTTLAKYGAAYLKSMGKSQSIELTAADLSGTNTEIDRFRLAQYVRVNSKPHGLENELYVVSKLSLNLVNPAENKLCLGSETATLTGQISGGSSYSSSASSINIGGGGAGYDPAGSASAALQEAKEYADDKDAETLSSAKSYTDTAAAEKLDKSTKYAGSDVAGGAANSAKKLQTDAGDASNPVYFKNGVPVKCGHSVKKDVPENADFSDTKDTAGVTRFPSSQQRLYLIGCPTDVLGDTLSYGSTYTYADSYILNGNLYINGKKIAYDDDISTLESKNNEQDERLTALENKPDSDTKDTAGITRFSSSLTKLYLVGCATDLFGDALGDTIFSGTTHTYKSTYIYNNNLYINGKKVAYAADAYVHPTYNATDVGEHINGTKQLVPGTPFTLPSFHVDETGHVDSVWYNYYNIALTIDSALSDTSKNAVQNKVITSKINAMDSVVGQISRSLNAAFNQLDEKVDKVDGKGLSTNDYTTADKTKLSGIAEGANKTVVDSDLSTTSTNPVQNKVVSGQIAALKNSIALNRTTLGTQCKNLFDWKNAVAVKSGGVTFNKSDNDISVTSFGAWASVAYKLPDLEIGVKYTFSATVSDLSNVASSVKIRLAYSSGGGNPIADMNLAENGEYKANFTPTKSTVYVLFYPNFSNDVYTNSFTASDIMLRYAGITDSTYEPYVEGINSRTIRNLNDTALIKTALGYECKNLIKPIYQTSTIQGVTFNVNSDNSVTANGTNNLSTSDANLKIFDQQLERGTYILTGGVSETFRLRLGTGTSNTFVGRDIGNGFTFTVSEKARYVILCQVPKSETANNITYYPMLRYADITDGTYEEYKPSLQEQINEICDTSKSGKLLYSMSEIVSSPLTVNITDLFTAYTVVVCNVVTSDGRHSLTLPLQYIKSLGTSTYYEAEGILFFYVDDDNIKIATGMGQSNPTINIVKIINLL